MCRHKRSAGTEGSTPVPSSGDSNCELVGEELGKLPFSLSPAYVTRVYLAWRAYAPDPLCRRAIQGVSTYRSVAFSPQTSSVGHPRRESAQAWKGPLTRRRRRKTTVPIDRRKLLQRAAASYIEVKTCRGIRSSLLIEPEAFLRAKQSNPSPVQIPLWTAAALGASP